MSIAPHIAVPPHAQSRTEAAEVQSLLEGLIQFAKDYRRLQRGWLRFAVSIICAGLGMTFIAVGTSNAAGPLTYYVSAAGNDSNSGTSETSPWRTISKVNAHRFLSGESVVFRRGDTFQDASLVMDDSGTSSGRITVGAFGVGSRPILDGGGSDTSTGRRTPIAVTGNYVSIDSIQVQHAQYAGIDLFGTDAQITNSLITHNATGVQQNPSAARALITLNSFVTNNILVIGPGQDDDYGAQGVALGGADADVSYNSFSGHYNTGSPDYGVDGAAIEVFGSKNANIHHNRSRNDLIFSELGNAASGTVLHHNVMYSSISAAGGINIHGAGTYGRVTGTKVLNNTIVLTAGVSTVFVADGGADCELKNNILVAATSYSENPIDEAGNVWKISSWQGVNSINARRSKGVANTSTTTGLPGLISPSTGDFRLLSSSAAINRGVAASTSFTSDFAGVVQQGGSWDSGAYELS